MDSLREETDKAMMARCVELSRIAVGKGEYPFGTVIALDGQILAEAINHTVRDGDVTRHAEVIALSQAGMFAYWLSPRQPEPKRSAAPFKFHHVSSPTFKYSYRVPDGDDAKWVEVEVPEKTGRKMLELLRGSRNWSTASMGGPNHLNSFVYLDPSRSWRLLARWKRMNFSTSLPTERLQRGLRNRRSRPWHA